MADYQSTLDLLASRFVVANVRDDWQDADTIRDDVQDGETDLSYMYYALAAVYGKGHDQVQKDFIRAVVALVLKLAE